MEPDTGLPWESTDYQLDALAREVGVSFFREFIRDYFARADEIEIDGHDATLYYEGYLPAKVRNGGDADWYTIGDILSGDDDTVVVEISIADS